ncbi:uncharacterized protein ACA1_123810 [Acanthamoeba castellanii str. Neff]|uniref:Uncharacterized protein n=1 Tax=Acanthamoeba castellanii (strain ATCC 30010 / Neff) TaxID=1257118 RepID=L8HF33_ACACF|nr:uncharacterized protein ACA1_123810 [Acanthamoeba castellanii str. Neff]ELR23862.1 hypothetical protein ACA1_123810 [Acanthamoeba castellanii str. Neff]
MEHKGPIVLHACRLALCATSNGRVRDAWRRAQGRRAACGASVAGHASSSPTPTPPSPRRHHPNHVRRTPPPILNSDFSKYYLARLASRHTQYCLYAWRDHPHRQLLR